MIYMLWQTGRFTNQEIAKLFGLTYSSVSRRVGIVRKQLGEDKLVKDKLDRPNVLIKMRYHIFSMERKEPPHNHAAPLRIMWRTFRSSRSPLCKQSISSHYEWIK